MRMKTQPFASRNVFFHFTLTTLTLLFTIAPLAQNSPLYISDPSTLLGASSRARGGATLGTATTHDSLFQNPASSAHLESYAVSAGYIAAGNAVFASIIDTKSGPIGGGLYYLRRDIRDDQANNISLGNLARYEEHAGLSLMGKVQQNMSIGTTVRYAYRRSYDSRIENATDWNLDVGLQYLVRPDLAVGLLGQNLLTSESGFSAQRLGAGVGYSLRANLGISAQIFKTQAPMPESPLQLPSPNAGLDYALGAEFLPGKSFVLRAGFQESPTWLTRKIATGAGYISSNFSLDYAFQIDAKKSANTDHTITFTGYF